MELTRTLLIFILFYSVPLAPLLISPASSKAGDPESAVIIPNYALSPNQSRTMYETQKGGCKISLEVSQMGGFQILTLTSTQAGKNTKVNNVTGVAYHAKDSLVFTVGSVYGKPGVYLYNCISKQQKRIVNPRTINKDYPYGADYFELQDVRGNDIYFYYTPDVDSTNFTSFRSGEFLHEVRMDGTGFRKVPE